MSNLARFFSIAFLLAAAGLQSGCSTSASGFHREDMFSQAGVTEPKYDNEAIKAAFAKKANLPKRFKLAVYFKDQRPYRFGSNVWRWTEEDKKQLNELADELKKEGLISEIIPIISSVVVEQDLKSLRLAAANHHADALLIVGGAGEIEHYYNNYGYTYAALLPMLFVKGSEVDTLFVTNASLWDVRNEFLYLTAEAEATKHKTYIAFFADTDKELYNEAKTESLKNLKTELKRVIRGGRMQKTAGNEAN